MLQRLFALLLGLALVPAQALAQGKATKIVVAFPPGGPVDIVARILAEPLTKELGHPVIIENKPGANAIIASEYAARSPADGSVVYLSSMGATVFNPLLYANLPYDAKKDFAPISRIISSPSILAAHPSNPAKDAAEFVAAAKAGGKPIAIASTGMGSTTHLTLEIFIDATKMPTLHVPYKGAAPAIADLVNNQVSGFIGDLPGLVGQLQSGKLKALGVAAPKGHSLVPGVKTLAEQGIPGVEFENWYALLAPAKTPPETIASLNKAVRAALANQATREKLINTGCNIIPSSPEEVTKAIDEASAKWAAIIKEKGIKAE